MTPKAEKIIKNTVLGLSLCAVAAMAFPYRDAEGAKETLQKGTELTDIQIKEDRSFFGCGKGDIFRTTFTAKNTKGQQVDGVVCKGLFKGSTIRYQ